MAFGSAFGFSAYDPIMSMVEGSVNNYWDKKSESRAFARQLQLMEKQYEYAQRYSENSPTWSVKGLRDAGINPILAVSNGVHTSAQVPMIPSSASHRSPITSKASFNASGLLPFDRRIATQNADAQTLSAQAADKQADAALLKARTDSSESASRIAKTMADADLLKQDFKRNESNGGWRNDIVSDLTRLLNKSVNLFEYSLENQRPENDLRPFLQHGPTRNSDGYDGLKFSPPTKDEEDRWKNKPRRNSRRTIPLSPLPYQTAL